jgi:hypothetical protein
LCYHSLRNSPRKDQQYFVEGIRNIFGLAGDPILPVLESGMVDLGFVKELDDTGFIQSLDKK